jgi:Raf kinase inhibitor-like YbhB/YbcL family protein
LARFAAVATLVVGLVAGAANADQAAFSASSPDLPSSAFSATYALHAFGCSGTNVSPAVQWKNAPAGTKSFALQVRDENAAGGSPFWHWTVYNIPANATGLPRGAGNAGGSLPLPAFNGVNDFVDTGATGANGAYGGPCPPAGDKPHRYVFAIYALAVDDVDAAAGIPKSGSPDLYSFVLNKMLGDKVLGKASFTAVYGR